MNKEKNYYNYHCVYIHTAYTRFGGEKHKVRKSYVRSVERQGEKASGTSDMQGIYCEEQQYDQ